eukprot:2901122-Prymnesium_polylepis.2
MVFGIHPHRSSPKPITPSQTVTYQVRSFPCARWPDGRRRPLPAAGRRRVALSRPRAGGARARDARWQMPGQRRRRRRVRLLAAAPDGAVAAAALQASRARATSTTRRNGGGRSASGRCTLFASSARGTGHSVGTRVGGESGELNSENSTCPAY